MRVTYTALSWERGNGSRIDLYSGTRVESHDYSTRCGKVTLYVLD